MPHLPARFAGVILAFAALRPPLLAPRPGAPGRRAAGAGPARSDERTADHRALARPALRQPPPRAQPRDVVSADGRTDPARPPHRRLRAQWSPGHGGRRHDRAPLGASNSGQGKLSRPRALVGRALRQDQWAALDEPHAAGAHPLGRAGLGAALPDGARSVRTSRSQAGSAAQVTPRRRTADGPSGAPLAAGPRSRARRRQRLLGLAVPRRHAPRRRHRRHPPSTRRGALRSGPAPPGLGTIGRPRKKGARLLTLRDVLAAQSTCWKSVQVAGRSRCGRARHRDRHGHRRVAARRPARRAAPGVLVRDPEGRFAPQARLGTDPARDPAQIVAWFVRRWCVEVTFQEARAHLGVETQRQWSDKAIARTTPCLLALFSVVALAGGSPPRPRAATGRGHGVVRQGSAHLQRRPGRRAPGDLARAGFGDVRVRRPSDETSPQPAGALGLRPLPRRLNGQSRTQG